MSDPIDQEIRILRAIFWSERDPEGRAFVPLADAYLRKGSPEEALSLLEDGLARHADFASAHLVAARVHRALGRADGVEAALATVLTLDPGNAPGLRMRGELAEGQGDREGAIAAFREALERNPGYEDLVGRVERLEAGLPMEPFHLGPRETPDAGDGGGDPEVERPEDAAPATLDFPGGEEAGSHASGLATGYDAEFDGAFDAREGEVLPASPEALGTHAGMHGEGEEAGEAEGWEFPEIDFPDSASDDFGTGDRGDSEHVAAADEPPSSEPHEIGPEATGPWGTGLDEIEVPDLPEPQASEPLSFEPGVFGELLPEESPASTAEEPDTGVETEEAARAALAHPEGDPQGESAADLPGDTVADLEREAGADLEGDAGAELAPDPEADLEREAEGDPEWEAGAELAPGLEANLEGEAEAHPEWEAGAELAPGLEADLEGEAEAHPQREAEGGAFVVTPVDDFAGEEVGSDEGETTDGEDPFDLDAFPSDDPGAYPVPGMATDEEEVLASDLISSLDPVETSGGGEEGASGRDEADSEFDRELTSLSFEPREDAEDVREPRLSDDLSVHEALAEAAGGGKEGGASPAFDGTGRGESEAGLPVTRTLGELYARQGLREEALRVFQRLAERSPEDASLQDRIRELEGGPDEARPIGAATPSSAEPETPAADSWIPSPAPDASEEGEASSAPHLETAGAEGSASPAREAAMEDLPARLARHPVGDYFHDLMTWSAGAVPIEELSPEARGPAPGAVAIEDLAPGAGGPPPTGVPSPLHPAAMAPDPEEEEMPDPEEEGLAGDRGASGVGSPPVPEAPDDAADREPEAEVRSAEAGGEARSADPPATPEPPPSSPPSTSPPRTPPSRASGHPPGERPASSPSEAFEGLDDFQDWLRSLNR